MEKILKEEFDTSSVISCGGGGGGCINSGSGYILDDKKVFVKVNGKPGSRLMFDGEYASLLEIDKTMTVKVPKPLKVFGRGDGSYLVMEYFDMTSLRNQAASLGEKLAHMHLHNANNKNCAMKNEGFVGKETNYVDKFGFHVATCCGFIPMKNDWMDDWVQFYVNNRLIPQLKLIEQNYTDRDARNIWPQVERNISKLFPSNLQIVPSLLHGDLWGGNAAEVESVPCVFDPACFYGHCEYELAISHMFGGFPPPFFQSYHSIIPKAPDFDKRLRLYQLFHYLNHWNHFGSSYKSASMSIMKDIAHMS